MLDRETNMMVCLGGNIPINSITTFTRMAKCSGNLTNTTACSELELGILRPTGSDNSIGEELKGTNIPTKHVWRKSSLHASEEEGDSDTPEPNATIKRIPSRHLRAGGENIRQSKRHNTQDGVMFPVA